MANEGDRVSIRLGRGCRAFAVMDQGQVVAYGWMSTRPEWIGELSLEVAPVAGEAYVWNCVTLAPHRRRGMYRALLEGIVSRARAEGLKRLWIGSVEHPAEKADADAGFTEVLHFRVRRLGALRWLRARPAPLAEARHVEEARRRLGLRSWSSVGRAVVRVH
jgi:GNAT superfamily N-acetyltransferase